MYKIVLSHYIVIEHCKCIVKKFTKLNMGKQQQVHKLSCNILYTVQLYKSTPVYTFKGNIKDSST